MNRAEQDYLKAIYELTYELNTDLVKPSELSLKFEITDQSVNEMIKKLVSKKLLVFYPYKGVGLTKQGLKNAIEMIRAHRLWEVFLTQKLGFSWQDVHFDAENLEHATSKKVLDALAAFLGHPKYCQHGNPIPNEIGQIEHKNNMPIAHYALGTKLIIDRVMDTKELLVFLDQENLKLNDVITIEKIDTFNDMMAIKKESQIHWLSIQTAQMIYASKIN